MTYKAKGPKNEYGDRKEYTVGYTVETDCHKSSYDGKLIGTARIDFYAREIEKEDQWADKTWVSLQLGRLKLAPRFRHRLKTSRSIRPYSLPLPVVTPNG